MTLSENIESAKIVFKSFARDQALSKQQEYALERALSHSILQERGACAEIVEKSIAGEVMKNLAQAILDRSDKYIVDGILR